ncbi:MAG: UDP-2,3-diacylglucosamine diphosphatase LpxI [Pseudomonadota bacterium]
MTETNPTNLPALGKALAIVAGSGVLPRMLAEDCALKGQPYRVVQFEGVPLDWVADHPVIEAIFEKPGRLFADLKAANCADVTFAGGMTRPKLSPFKFDFKGLRLAPSLFSALRSGDDRALRIINGIFEAEGLRIRAPHELLEKLLMAEGTPTKATPSKNDQADAQRAAQIVQALGEVDVGQGAVVAQGLCLGTESIQGTDAMLAFVANSDPSVRPDPDGAKGVLLKAPKPGQDWRVDLPAIGPDTLTRAKDAGLAGVVVQADGVLVLGLEETVARADELGLFLWGRPADAPPNTDP